MIASYTCAPVQPLPSTILTYGSDPDAGAYTRQEDRSLVASGSQLMGWQGYPTSTVSGSMGQSQGNPSDPASASGDGFDVVGGPAAVPGTFRPCGMSETALAMRCVCRLWCEVLSEGVRTVTLYGNQFYTLWASHFPLISTLRLESCCDLFVRSSSEAPAAHQQQQRRRHCHCGDDDAGPGPSSSAAAAAPPPAAASQSRAKRRAPRSGTAAGHATRGSAAAAAAATGGAGYSRSRSLAALTSLRNLLISDTTVHLDLAASCPSLEELVVRAQQQTQQYGTYMGRNICGGLVSAGAGRRGSAGQSGPGGTGVAQAVSRRSAIDRTLSGLPGLRRLRLSGLDASAARLGSTLMELTGLTSLRLHQCRLPRFIGAPERARAGHNNFGRELMLNLGAKLQDLSLRGCSVRVLPDEVLAGLSGLRILDLSCNWLNTLPTTVSLMTRLEYLDLQHNALGSLPEGMGVLPRLLDLDLSGNYLHRLPQDFSQLTPLTYLNLGGLHSLDMEVCWPLLANLTNLRCLGLSDVDLSEDVGNPAHAAQQQQQQRTWQGPLHALVSALAPAGQLRELTLDGCGLTNLPACFSDLTALSHLSLMENFDASGLPEVISSLRNLAVLGLGYLDLQAPLPDSLYDMASLRVLDLQQNLLPAVSPNISKLSNLQVLNLLDAVDATAPGNAIPWAAIYHLTRLRQLSVTGHKVLPFAGLLPGIRALASLEMLQLFHVDTPLVVLEELCRHVRGLTCLELVECDIPWLPTGLTRLLRLTDLRLTGLGLRSLPAGFGALTRLTDLDLSSNEMLRSLPADITRLTRLHNFSWSVTRGFTAPPSAEQLAWMARLPYLAIDGKHNFAALAKSYNIVWPKRTVCCD